MLGAVALAAIVGIWFFAFRGRPAADNAAAQSSARRAGGLPSVETILPTAGGIDRISVQPGSVEPFESENVFAKVSGYLVETKEIGDRVAKGSPLVRIAVPESVKQVKINKASVAQAEAQLAAIKAEGQASEQQIAQATIEFKSKTAFRSYRSKQLERIKALYKESAVDAKLVDEESDRYEAALEAENAARESVTTAQLKSAAVKAKVTEAEANIDYAKAQLERAEVLDAYTSIDSKYDGVVTERNYSPGAFIRAADVGGSQLPIISVDRIDLMRVVVQVPNTDAPYVDKGDPVEIVFDALPKQVFKGVVARTANKEDSQNRTLRTEIDLPNLDGKLHRNMYGSVRMNLQVGGAGSFPHPDIRFGDARRAPGHGPPCS